MSIYHWKLGDIALAKVCKKAYAVVRVVKNEEGLFHDEKVLGISANEDGSIMVTRQLCYYVEISRTCQRLWLPYTSLHLAERRRPSYGADRMSAVSKSPSGPRKRKIKEDHILPLEVKPIQEEDLNTTYEVRHTISKQCNYENAFSEFVRRGKDELFDYYYLLLERDGENNLNSEVLDYLKHVDASTEDKFEMAIRDIVTEKEIENYLHQCWRYSSMLKQTLQSDSEEGSDHSNEISIVKMPVTLHTPWCLVCGQAGSMRECSNCPSSFHVACRGEWLVNVIHRKRPPQMAEERDTLVDKILSSTRLLCSVYENIDRTQLCPSCMWGPRVGYNDIVWHKLGPCSWWPARVLTPGSTPSCLLSRSHSPHEWPLRYYGTLDHAWADADRMSLFLPRHAPAWCAAFVPALRHAVLDACDDYITVYLT